MALDETAHAALRRLRVQSTPLAEDRARIKARLAPIFFPAMLTGLEPSSPRAPAQDGVGTGTGPLGLPEPGLITTGASGAATGGLVGSFAVKVGAVVLCASLATAAWVGVSHRGASSRVPAASGAFQRSTPPSASRVPSSSDAHSDPMPSASGESAESGDPRDGAAEFSDRAAAEPAAKPAPRVAPVRTKSVGAPARDALQSELEALRAAQEALRDGDPQAALRQLEKREKNLQLARDRQGLRAVALCDSKQSEAGRKAAEQFLRRHSSSALARRVRAACAEYLASGAEEGTR